MSGPGLSVSLSCVLAHLCPHPIFQLNTLYLTEQEGETVASGPGTLIGRSVV
jgi:hypothetical protein